MAAIGKEIGAVLPYQIARAKSHGIFNKKNCELNHKIDELTLWPVMPPGFEYKEEHRVANHQKVRYALNVRN
jgi:hypothetical protein